MIGEKNQNGIFFDFWACQRPLTHHWGSGQVEKRLVAQFGPIDVAFGKQDQISEGITTVDIDATVNPTVVADWKKLPFPDNYFAFGYWDPPLPTENPDSDHSETNIEIAGMKIKEAMKK